MSQLVDTARALGGGTGGQALMVTDSWAISAQIIDATGADVLTDGGYSGHVPVFTAARLKDLVHTGRVRLFAVADGAPSPTRCGRWRPHPDAANSGPGRSRPRRRAVT